MSRSAESARETRETRIRCRVDLDGTGTFKVATPIGFFTHMLETLSKHSLIDIELELEGDLEVDQHHSIEDAGLVFGETVLKALGDLRGIRRNGDCLYPMDEVLARCALDLSGRAGCVFRGDFQHRFIGEMESTMVREFFHAVASRLQATLHLEVLTPGNDHHMAEALFKSFAKSLRQAVEIDARVADQVPSTKGTLSS